MILIVSMKTSTGSLLGKNINSAMHCCRFIDSNYISYNCYRLVELRRLP